MYEFLFFIGLITLIWWYANNNRSDSFIQPIYKRPVDEKKELQHPVLKYQQEASLGTVPASWGDPIRPMLRMGPSPSRFFKSGSTAFDTPAYGLNDCPYPGKPMGIPVPYFSLKQPPSEYYTPLNYNIPQNYEFNRPMMSNITRAAGRPYEMPYSAMYAPLYLPLGGNMAAIGSVDNSVPLPIVQNRWEKIGIVKTVSTKDDTIMNLYAMAISPGQDIYQYQVQDKNNFVIPLRTSGELENGDRIPFISGYEGLGAWIVDLFPRNKWVYV